MFSNQYIGLVCCHHIQDIIFIMLFIQVLVIAAGASMYEQQRKGFENKSQMPWQTPQETPRILVIIPSPNFTRPQEPGFPAVLLRLILLHIK